MEMTYNMLEYKMYRDAALLEKKLDQKVLISYYWMASRREQYFELLFIYLSLNSFDLYLIIFSIQKVTIKISTLRQ